MSKFKIVKGAYEGTTDDRFDRWYIQKVATTVIDRRGKGYKTKEQAKRALKLKKKYIDQEG